MLKTFLAVAAFAAVSVAQDCPLGCGDKAESAKVVQTASKTEGQTCAGSTCTDAAKVVQTASKTEGQTCEGSTCTESATIVQTASKTEGQTCAGATCTESATIVQASARTEGCCGSCAEKAASGQVIQASAKAEDCCGGCAGEASTATIVMTGVSTEAEECDSACAEGGACCTDERIAVAKAAMPTFGYKVGDTCTACPTEAASLATSATPAVFVVNGTEYTCHESAGRAYSKALAKHLDSMTRIQFVVNGKATPCPMECDEMKSGSESVQVAYRVGTFTYDCPDKAIRAAAMAYGCSQSSAMSYKVDDADCACPVTAAKAKETGHKVQYVVAGKTTECDVEASIMLTQVRIQKAIDALASIN